MTRILRFSLLVLLIAGFSRIASGQPKTRVLTLPEVIEIAKRQSPDALTAMHRFRSSYWQYRNYKAGLMPMLTLDATLPSLSRSIEKIITTEGDVYSERNVATYSSGLSLTKNLGLTGGQIFLNSNLQRLDQFGDSTISSYLSTPLNIGINQPLFNYNAYKWLRKTEPMRYSEAERRYLEDVERVAISATEQFFSLLDAQIRLKIQQLNQSNNDTLYQIARGRYNIGTIAENELLQIELSLLNSRSAVENANLDVEMKTFNLRSFLRLSENETIVLVAPQSPPAPVIEAQLAINEARENRADALAFDRRLIEAEGAVNKARTENRFNANLFAVYGLTQSTDDIRDVYRDPQEQQQLELGISIPILDWGYARGRIKLAESDQELQKTAVQQEMLDFDQEVFLKVMQFNMQRNQLIIAAKSDTVALKRYEVTKQRYLIGKIGITDLNIAQTEKDNAQQGYIAALSLYWRSFYELRRLTLYDFIAHNRIIFHFEDIPDVE